MKKGKIKFRFTFEDGSTMEVSHIGKECPTKDDAEAKAWQSMAADNFNRTLILKTVKIERVDVEFV